MWTTDFRIATRQIRQRPGLAALNVAGLAVGLACCLLLGLFVRDELSFDRSHPHAERLFRLEQDLKSGGSAGTEMQRWANVETPLADDVLPQVAGIEATLRLADEPSPLVVHGQDRVYEDRFLYAEPAFFAVFDAHLVRGRASDLARPFTVVLSEPTARRYFGDADPLGQTLDVRSRYGTAVETYEVVGVMRATPANAHVHADFVASFVSQLSTDPAQRWSQLAYTYVRLTPGTDAAAVGARIQAARTALRETDQVGIPSTVVLTPVTDLHLRGRADQDIEPQGDIRYVGLFLAIAVVILLIAGVNYTNLATARGAQRTKEVGVRKALGAGRGSLVRLFIAESLATTAVAFAVALALVALALPAFEGWTGRPLSRPWAEPWLWAGVVAGVAALGVGAGAYPAFVLSLVRPTSALRGTGAVPSRALLRKVLVAGQLTATIALVACTIGIQRQLAFVQHARLGFDPEQALVVRTRGALDGRGDAFRQAAEQIPGVRSVAFGSGVPSDPSAIAFYSASDIEGQTGDGEFIFDLFEVGAAFVPTLGIEMAQGHAFAAEGPSGDPNAVLINEAAVRKLGWDAPLGRTIGTGEHRRTVVGVVRDMHLQDMRQQVGPAMFAYDPDNTAYAVLRLGADDLPATLAAVERAWDAAAPDQLFDAFFLDDAFAAMYRSEHLVGQVFLAFTLLAVCVACLGLFGLAMLTAEGRTKEIGVRKVLGASVGSLVALLSREVVALVAVAFAAAVPVAYLFLRAWLSGFAYRADPTVGLFLGAGAATLAVAVLAVGLQALRAATADPVRALRSE